MKAIRPLKSLCCSHRNNSNTHLVLVWLLPRAISLLVSLLAFGKRLVFACLYFPFILRGFLFVF